MKSKTSNPFDKNFVKIKKSSVKSAARSVKPVAKDTNKTRRKRVKPTSKKAL